MYDCVIAVIFDEWRSAMRNFLGLLLVISTCGFAQEMKAFYIQEMQLFSASYISNAKQYPHSDASGQDMESLPGVPAGHAFDGLLQRLKNAGYNTIVSSLPLRIYESTSPLGGTFYLDGQNNIQVFKEALEAVDAYGMKLVPQIQINTKNWDNGWHIKFPDSTINKLIMNGQTIYASPTASHPEFDTVYAQLLRRLNTEYQAANLNNTAKDSYPSIWLSYDEYWLSDNSKPGIDAFLPNYFLGRTSLSDRRAIAAEMLGGNTTRSQAYRIVYSKSLLNRLNILQEQFGVNAKFYAFANAFIPQTDDGLLPNFHWDNVTKFCMVGEFDPAVGVCPESGETVTDLPGLDSGQKIKVKSGVILVPWIYHDFYTKDGQKFRRDIEGAAKAITMKGFTMLPFSALPVAEVSKTAEGSEISALRESMIFPRQASMQNTGFATAVYPGESWQISSNIRYGWMAAWLNFWWPTSDIYNQAPEYQVIEFGASAYSAGLLNKVSGY